MMENTFIPYTSFEIKRYEMMKGYVDAFHMCRSCGDFEGYRAALADLSDLFATTFREKVHYESCKNRAVQVRSCKGWISDGEFLSGAAKRLENMAESYGDRIKLSFERWMTGSDKLDAAVGFGPMRTVFNVGRDEFV